MAIFSLQVCKSHGVRDTFLFTGPKMHCMDCVFYVYMNVLKYYLYGVWGLFLLIALEGTTFVNAPSCPASISDKKSPVKV